MPYSERTVAKTIEINVLGKTIHVIWVKQVLRNGEVLAETSHRKAYTSADREVFLADLPEYAMCAGAIEWVAEDAPADEQGE